jgi:hypothetical protein
LQPTNTISSTALHRIEKAIRASKLDVDSIESKMMKIKEMGNGKYSLKKYDEAVLKFTEGIDIYLKD